MKIIIGVVIFCTSLFSENTSLRFTQGNYARIPVVTEVQNADEVTIEIWYYEESSSGEENIIGNEWFGGNFEIYRDSDGTIDWGENHIQASPQGSGHWMHIAGTYSSTQGRKLFINGILVDSCNDCPLAGGQYTGSESMYDGIWLGTFDDLTINRHTWGGESSSSSRLSGYVEELRISTVVRYTENFDVPTFEFQNDEDTAGLWHFNNNLNDESGNGHHGTGFGTSFASNTPGLNENISGCTDSLATNYDSDANVDDGSCEYSNNNYSLSINGSGQRIEVGGISIENTYSLGSWVKFPLPETADGHNGLFMGESPVSYQLAIHGISREIGIYQTDTGGDYVDWWLSGYNIEHLSGWHFLSVVAENGTTNFYVDGSEVGTSNFVISTPILRIGNTTPNYNDGTQYIGVIDDPAIWNYALSPEEFQNQMEIGLDGSEPGLVAYWDLNEGSGSIANDLSGNGYNGTIYNAYFVEETPQLISGCTDENANNFNASANLNNESCEYIENSNYSLQFNGSPSTVNLGFLNEFNDNGNLTLEAWVKLSIHNGNNRIFTLGGNGHMAIGIHLDGIPYIINVIGGNNGYEAVGNYPLELETWYHIVGIYDNPNNLSILYVNGEFQNSTPTPDAPFYHPNSSSSNIGSYYQPFYGSHFTGKIAGLLFSQNIKYSSEFNPQYPITSTEQLVGFWPATEGNGNSLLDISSNNNHGSMNNIIWSTDAPIPDCTDELATNYNSEANFDNGSCEYDTETPDPTVFTYGGVYGDHSYYLSNEQTTYYEAVQLCDENGGHIVAINSAEENNFVSDILIQNQSENQNYENWNLRSYIGLNKDSGSWQWVTGDPVNFTSWAPATGEPSGDGNCAVTNHDIYHPSYTGNSNYNENYKGYWNDLYCDGQARFVLEIEGVGCTEEEDICGVCGGDNSSCLPESTELAFYYFTSITLDGESAAAGSEIIAKNETSDRIVGFAEYGNVGNGITEVIVYGSMGAELDELFGTDGYMTSGDTPQFYVNGIKAHYIAANGDELQTIQPFISLEQYADLSLNLTTDCNGNMGGSASVDYCGDCWGGNSGNGESINDPDGDEVCGEADNCPDIANTDQLNYDGDAEGNACDSDDDNDGEADETDEEPLNEFACHDDDNDSCDECADGSLGDTNDDGVDNDEDGWCNAGDNWPDCSNEVVDVDPYDECENCNGDGFAENCIGTDDCENMDCSGNCGQDSYIDACGECDNDPNTDCYDLSLDLHAGANLISFPALPEDTSVESIFTDTGCIVLGLIGEGTGAVFQNGIWIGSLSEIKQEDGYWVKVYDDCTITLLDAEPVSYDADGPVEYNMEFGANLISYPFQSPQEIGVALGDASDNIYGIISEGVAANNMDGNWVGSLSEFTGGKGYWLMALIDFNFIFNGTEQGIARNFETTVNRLLPESFQFTQSTQQAFFFIEGVSFYYDKIEFDDILIAYNGDVVVGARYWNGEFTDIPAMGQEDDQFLVDYCNAGDEISFRLFDASENKLINMEIDGESYWQEFGMSIIRLNEVAILPEQFSLGQAYPNPFNPITTIKYALPIESAISIMVYDLAGREVATLINSFSPAGYHTVTWNAESQSSGVYFVHFHSDTFREIQKIMLIK